MQDQATQTKPALSRPPVRTGMTCLRFLELALEDPKLTSEEFRLLTALALSATWRPGTEGADCFPSHGTLGRKIGRSGRSVRRYLAVLERKGWVISHRRLRTNGSWTSNLYQLAVPPVADPDGRGWLGPGPGEGGVGQPCPTPTRTTRNT